MGLDIRLPLGLLFAAIGVILLGYGLLTQHSAIYAISMGINLNILWGAVMCVFGLAMLLFSRRKKV